MSEPLTSIAAHTTIKGELHLDGPGIIAGRIQGDVAAHDSLELTAEGVVNGNIQGTTVAIHGTVKGNITATQNCQLGPTARVAGEVRAADLAIAKGARFIGHVCVGEIEKPIQEVPEETRAEDAADLAPPVTATVQILTDNVEAALRRGSRIIKAR